MATSLKPIRSSFWDQPRMLAIALIVVVLPNPLAWMLGLWIHSALVYNAGFGVSLLLAWGALRLRGMGWKDLGLTRKCNFPRALGIAACVTILLLGVTPLIVALMVRLTGRSANISGFDFLRGSVTNLLVVLGLIWTLAAFGEEMLWRGYLINSLHDLVVAGGSESRLSWAVPLLISSVLFGAAHSYQGIAGVTLSAIIGFGFGLTYLAAKRNLWASILTHGFYDTVGFLAVFWGWDKPPTPLFVPRGV